MTFFSVLLIWSILGQNMFSIKFEFFLFGLFTFSPFSLSYHSLNIHYGFCHIYGVACIRYCMEEMLDHANYHVWLHFSYHLIQIFNFAHCCCRRQNLNPGHLLSKRVRCPLLPPAILTIFLAPGFLPTSSQSPSSPSPFRCRRSST